MNHFIDFEVIGDRALFSDPITRVGGEKITYPIPTYEALKGISESIYWKPAIRIIVEKVRIMNPIHTESEGIRLLKYAGGTDLATYTYLQNVRYQVRVHLMPNYNHPQFEKEWHNMAKHIDIFNRMVQCGGRRDVFLGTRECQAYVQPCVFGEGEGYYDTFGDCDFGFMYHGITYADEAVLQEEKGKMTINFWRPVMRNGVIELLEPENCPTKKFVKKMKVTPFKVREEVDA